jgi:hypothetical protein
VSVTVVGAAERFDANLTVRWSDHIAACIEADDGDGSFGTFVERYPDLRRSDLLGLPKWKQATRSSCCALAWSKSIRRRPRI